MQLSKQKFVIAFFVVIVVLIVCFRFLYSGPKYSSSNGQFTVTVVGNNKVLLSGNTPGTGLFSGTGTLTNNDHVHVVATNTMDGKTVEVFGLISGSQFKGMYESSAFDFGAF